MDLAGLLDRGLDRKYSASPGESFFTGGGRHTFSNFDPDDNNRILTVREAAIRSTNLIFIRLMRDLVRFHEARLPYDSGAVLAQPEHPERRRLLKRIAHQEGLRSLRRSYRKYRGLSIEELVPGVLGSRSTSSRRLAILFFAWHPGGDAEALSRWLAERGQTPSAQEIARLRRTYGKPEFTLLDHGFLLRRDPVEVWCAGKLALNPDMGWADLKAQSGMARLVASSWLFRTRSRRAQNVRLRTWIEQDAFARMTPYWRRLGFPFERLVPSYATAIGSSGDRPSALAELMGIILNGGLRRPVLSFRQLRFGSDTPYHTVFKPEIATSERVMAAPVAGALRQVLEGVVDRGTARRVRGVFMDSEGSPVTVGGKTGSGDNRFQTFSRGGGKLSSRPVSRTASLRILRRRPLLWSHYGHRSRGTRERLPVHQRSAAGGSQATGASDQPASRPGTHSCRLSTISGQSSILTRPNDRLVGSRTGAVPRRPGLSVAPRFLWECLTSQTVGPFPAPATSHAACGFPALRAPAHFASRVMRPIMLEPLSVMTPGHVTRYSLNSPSSP